MESDLRDPRQLRSWAPCYDGAMNAVVPQAFHAPLEDLSRYLKVPVDRPIHVVQVHDTRYALRLHAPSLDDPGIFISRKPETFRFSPAPPPY